jgi:hypothetical protein
MVDQGADPALYRRVIDGLPGIWLEDPKIDDGTSPILEEVSSQVTWDAIIHSVEDIEALPWPPKTVNVKPSRFGSIRRLFAAYDYCEERGIGAYGGGQWELGPGRGHIQLLAALFHPDTPNDVAGSSTCPIRPGLPQSPLTVSPLRPAFSRSESRYSRLDRKVSTGISGATRARAARAERDRYLRNRQVVRRLTMFTSRTRRERLVQHLRAHLRRR